MALDREKWKVATPEKVKQRWPITDIRVLIKNVEARGRRVTETIDVNANNGTDSKSISLSSSKESLAEPEAPVPIPPPALEEVRTAEVFFIMLYVMAEYCHLVSMTCNPEVMLGLVDLLRGANVRLAHLVLGGGAVELKTCKSITVSILAAVVRGLGLLSMALPETKQVFKDSLPSKNHHLLKHVDTVQSEMQRHSDDIETKMLTILSEVIDKELAAWEARPPVPSTPLNNVSVHIVRFKEAIAPMLTQKQVSFILSFQHLSTFIRVSMMGSWSSFFEI